ncbi:MAG: Crp/Fnr family transcriptional regulator [Bacillota bacterium]
MVDGRRVLERWTDEQVWEIPLTLDEQEENAFCRKATRVFYPRGHVIFAPGDEAGRVYFIHTGVVKICWLSPRGHAVTMAIRYPRELFGLAEALCCLDRKCYAQALENTECYVIRRPEFELLLREEPDLCLKVARVLAARLRQAQLSICDFVRYQVPARLALLLLRLAYQHGTPSKEGIELRWSLTHQEIAFMVGASRQSVTSAFNAFKKHRLIRVERDRVQILNPQALAEWIT